MIDPIGMKPGALHGRPAAVTDPVDPVAQSAPVSRHTHTAETETDVGSVAREMAASPPVDRERVEQIRRAIAEGNYPIQPAKIADRLIAAQLDWASK